MKTLAKLIIILAAGFAVAAKPIGSVVSIAGDASGKQPGEQSRKLALKSEIYLSDSIETATASRLEVMFLDNSVISVGESSAMTIDEYVYAPAKKEQNSFSAKYKEGVFRAVSGNIAKLNPDRFKVKTRMATIGIRGSDVGSDLRNGEIHFCIQSHDPRGLTITPHQGNGNGRVFAFMPGMQAIVQVPGGGGWVPGFFRNRRPIVICRINPQSLADFLGALRMLEVGGPPVLIPWRQLNADPENLRPPLIPGIPFVPIPPAPQGDGEDPVADTLLASGTDWNLLKQADPVAYYLTGSAMGLAQVTALQAEASKFLQGNGSFFMTVTHALGNRDLDGTIGFNINIGGGFDDWNCQIAAANLLGDSFNFDLGTSGGVFDPGTGELSFSGIPITFALIVNGNTYTMSDITTGSLRGNLYGPTGIGPPAPIPTGAGINLNYTLLDGTRLNGAGGADVVNIPM